MAADNQSPERRRRAVDGGGARRANSSAPAATSSISFSTPPARCATASRTARPPISSSCRNRSSPRSTSPACSCPAASPISAAPSPASRCARAHPCRTFPRRRRSSRRCSRPSTVAYTDPKAGGSGGIMFAALLEKLGIADAINKKAVLGKRGAEVAALDRRGPRRDRHHLHQRSAAGEGRQGHRPAAGRSAQRQYLYGGDPGRQCVPGYAPRPCCARSPIRPPARAGPRPAWSRHSRNGHRSSRLTSPGPRGLA